MEVKKNRLITSLKYNYVSKEMFELQIPIAYNLNLTPFLFF